MFCGGITKQSRKFRADEKDVFTGKVKALDIARATYGVAQKMRVAISHKFGCNFGLSSQLWHESEKQPGMFTGNPSLSS